MRRQAVSATQGPSSTGPGVARGRRRNPAIGAVGVRPGVLLLAPVLAGLAFLVLPLLAIAARSISDQGAGGIVDMLGNELFVDALRRTLFLSLTVTALCWAIGTIYAIALVVSPRAIAGVLLAVLFITFWISALVRTFGWVLLFEPNGVLDQQLHKLGLIDEPLDLLQTTPAMYPAMVHVMLPFFILPVYAACLRLDPDLLRAAQSLGRTTARRAAPRRPAARCGRRCWPARRSCSCCRSSFYITPLLLGGPEDLTIATLIAREFGEVYDIGSAATMALILLIVVLALYLLVDRFVSLIPALGDRS